MRAFRLITLGVLALLLAAVLVRVAWVSDDAFITFRTIDNALNGYGLRWNPAERVQAYTHPLWLLLLLPVVAVAGNVYVSAVVLSLLLSAAAVAIAVWPVRHRPWTAAATLLALTLSKAFTDYSTSGLENPLSHLLLAALVVRAAPGLASPRAALGAGALVALCGTTRLDLLLLAGPIGLFALRDLRRTLLPFALGFAPLAAWEVFSIVYYGVPFPNTAYAKLATGVPQHELTAQGWRYVGDSIQRDPLTLVTIATAILAPFAAASWRLAPASLALLLYAAYVVRIGGDFMSGRFFSAPFLVAVLVLQRTHWMWDRASALSRTRTWDRASALSRTWRNASALRNSIPAVLAVAVGLAAMEPPPVLLTRDTRLQGRQIWRVYGVVDERTFYFPRTAFLTPTGFRTSVWFDDLRDQVAGLHAQHPTTVLMDTVGMAGYYVGPDRHIIDTFALADPLLARLPAERPWRIGHFRRELPAGYFESVVTGVNRIEDPAIAALYERILLATRVPVWTPARWRAIWELSVP